MTQVVLTTNFGTIKLKLNPDSAPETVENFLAYVKDGHYDGTIFHRVIQTFMIQGGGFTQDMKEKPTRAPIKNEADNGLKHGRYAVAMARTSDPHSASAQFFIDTGSNEFLNHTAPTPQGWGYAVFGKAVEGLDVIDEIAAVPTGNRAGHQDVPREPVVIESARVEE